MSLFYPILYFREVATMNPLALVLSKLLKDVRRTPPRSNYKEIQEYVFKKSVFFSQNVLHMLERQRLKWIENP